MDEELMDIIPEENIEVEPTEVIETEINIEDAEHDVSAEESVETLVETEIEEDIEIEIEESIGWVGGDSEKHYSLLGRDEPNQHRIEAITGLREELDDIERLQTVFSDKYNHANYYKWQEAPEIPIGLFVSCPIADRIKVCNSTEDILGVTVADAAFIGGQDDAKRDHTYGLVVCSGVVSVRCELDVAVGDSVVSNNYGYAKKAEGGYGYKVIGIQNIGGVAYAVIPLGISVNQVNDLMVEFDALGKRVGDVETDIVAAINVAQQAYNKSSEADNVSGEALKNALDALLKAEGSVDKTEELEKIVTSTNIIAVQAQTVANNAIVEAETIRSTAEATANNALAGVNNLIKELEPICGWEDTETGNSGAEYLATYIKDGLATKVEVQTVESLTQDNKSSIEKNAEGFRSLVSSVDKYSVGEYSQSYGLTHEQAESILKVGMIYVPTKHKDAESHSETFEDTKEVNEFTPGSYYEWGLNGQGKYDWIEYGNSVAFFSEEPSPSRVLRYWYIDSANAPDGYEPYSLYMWQDDKWLKVNIYYNNPSNRMTSSISQSVDRIAMEVVNARGSYAGLNARLTNTDASVDALTSWKNGEDVSEAIIRQVSDGDGASIVIATLIKEEEGGKEVTKEAATLTLTAKKDPNGTSSYLAVDAKSVNFTAEDYEIMANYIDLTGYVTVSALAGSGSTVINGDNITTGAIKSQNYVKDTNGMKLDLSNGTLDSKYFKVDLGGIITARGANIEGTITASEWVSDNFSVDTNGNVVANYITVNGGVIGGCTFDESGKLQITEANISGGISAASIDADSIVTKGRVEGLSCDFTGGSIGGWTISTDKVYKDDAGICSQDSSKSESLVASGLSPIRFYAGQVPSIAPFRVLNDGSVYVKAMRNDGEIVSYSGAEYSKIEGGTMILVQNPANGLNASCQLASIGLTSQINTSDYGSFVCGISNSTKNVSSVGWASNGGASIIFYGDEGMFNGTWASPSAVATTSDINKKNSITDIPDAYRTVFANLKPKIYKYNDGKSDRYHVGFIAQDVEEAILNAGLTTQDFAGFVRAQLPNEETGEPEDVCMLRYEEFIALNTLEIQKLNERIAKLEALIGGAI